MSRVSRREQKLVRLKAYFEAGDLTAARQIAQELLETIPQDEQVLYLLAQIVFRQGKVEESVELMKLLLNLNPLQTSYCNDHGVMLASLGRWDEAIVAHQMAVVLDQQNINARFNLALALLRTRRTLEARAELDCLIGLASNLPEAEALNGELLYEEGHVAEAVDAFRKAIGHGVKTHEVYINLAMALKELERSDEAMEALRTADRLDGGDAMACFQLGNLCRDKGQYELAKHSYTRAVALCPDLAEAHNNLGLVLRECGENEQAALCFEKALSIDPVMVAAYTNLGNLRQAQGLMEEAIESCQRALEINPQSAEAWNNLGAAYVKLRRLDEAETAFIRSFAINSEYAEADLNLGLLRLLRGEFADGWPHYESRWAMPRVAEKRPKFKQPEWLGEPLAGRTLLVYSEQGMGDNLQFVRYLPLLHRSYPESKIYFWSLPPLFRLFQSCMAAWGIEVLPPTVEGGLPPFDVQIALLSLPYRLGTELITIPDNVPYIHPVPELVGRWASRLAHLNGKKVGLVWRGGEAYSSQRFRSVRLKQLEALLNVEGISWVSLQKGNGASQIAEEGLSGRILDFMDAVDDFADTAAIIAQLDLIIGVDTSVPHLAGAMGVPVWLIDRFDSDWRWLLDRTDSPWYPSMRIFRQTSFGDWNSATVPASIALADWTEIPVRRKSFVTENTGSGMVASPMESGHIGSRHMLRLNLGCGNRKMDGFLNVDCTDICRPDMVMDLEKIPWPWKDNSVEEIKLIHVLEHLGQQTDVFLGIIREMYRVCCDGARIEIVVPHPRSDYFLGDPTHVRPITAGVLNLFNQRLNREWAQLGVANTPLGLILDVDFEVESMKHMLHQEWQDELDSGKIDEAEVARSARLYNNVIAQSTVIWRIRKLVRQK